MERELGLVDDENETRTLEQIAKQIDFLSTTIDDFRSFFKKDKEKQSVFLTDVIEEARMLMGGTLANSGISCRVQHQDAIEVEIFANELKQVLLSIINNAKDAILSSGTEMKMITIETATKGSAAAIRICDTGGGIDNKIIDRIFDPYFTTKIELQGTGIGLYLSKMIVEKNLKGTIRAENNERGACFIITLPLERSNRP